jgi:hypothetical protein
MKMTTTNSISYEREVKRILDELNDELYRQITKTKKEIILKGAKLLEQIGLPKKLIAAELSHGLRGVSRPMVYKTLGPEYVNARDDLSTSKQNDDKKVVEEDAKAVAAKYKIDLENDEPDEAVYSKLNEKLKIANDQTEWYKTKCEENKNLLETKERVSNEFVLHPDSYGGLREMMEKSPFGIRIMHDGQNVLDYKPVVK